MSLSNWLTRQEWNASYFAHMYWRGSLDDSTDLPFDLSFILRTGICILDNFGYKSWTGISVPDCRDYQSVHKEQNSKYGVNACVEEGDNSECLVEFMNGLNYKQRVIETIAWLSSRNDLDEEFKNSFKGFCEEILRNITTLQ